MNEGMSDEELKEIRQHAIDMCEDGGSVPLEASETFQLLDELERLRNERSTILEVLEGTSYDESEGPLPARVQALLHSLHAALEQWELQEGELREELRLARNQSELLPCPNCNGEGGEIHRYGRDGADVEYGECHFCDDELELTGIEIAVEQERRRAESHFYNIVGPLEDERDKLKAEVERLRQVAFPSTPTTPIQKPIKGEQLTVTAKIDLDELQQAMDSIHVNGVALIGTTEEGRFNDCVQHHAVRGMTLHLWLSTLKGLLLDGVQKHLEEPEVL